jgi:hypothetical protein
MALIKCTECGKEVSDRATLCPHCGIKLAPKPGVVQLIFGWAFLILLAAIIFAVVSDHNTKPGQEIKTTANTCAPDDLTCIINQADFKGFINASVYCKEDVEKFALHDVKWTDGSFELKFYRARWTDKPGGLMTYIGDKVEFQNGFGAYTPMHYACDLGADGKTVLDVRVDEGRLQ